MSLKTRIAIGALSFSMAGFVSLTLHESYTDTAVIPTKNDRPTVGFGSTFRDDGTPVRMGDTITPPRAVARSAAHIAKTEGALKRCVTGPLTQVEYDILVDFSYQYGASKTCASGMVRNINKGDYTAACRSYTDYKFSGGFDCSTPGNKVCAGVWDRNVKRRTDCERQLT